MTGVMADDWTDFDQTIGTPLEVHRQEMALHQGTACELQTDNFRFDDRWSASMDIVFSSTGDFSGDEPDEKSVTLSLSHSITDGAGRFVLHTYGFNNNWRNYFRVGNDVGRELEMIFGWQSEDSFDYQIRDGSGEPYFGAVVVPNFNPKYLIVAVAGMQGKIKCRRVGVNQ